MFLHTWQFFTSKKLPAWGFPLWFCCTGLDQICAFPESCAHFIGAYPLVSYREDECYRGKFSCAFPFLNPLTLYGCWQFWSNELTRLLATVFFAGCFNVQYILCHMFSSLWNVSGSLISECVSSFLIMIKYTSQKVHHFNQFVSCAGQWH